jgi:hypothetical protein
MRWTQSIKLASRLNVLLNGATIGALAQRCPRAGHLTIVTDTQRFTRKIRGDIC